MAMDGPRPAKPRHTYPDTPWLGGESIPCPSITSTHVDTETGSTHYIVHPPHPDAEKVWNEARILPHASSWAETDWQTLRHAVFALHRWHTDTKAPVSLLTEARRHLNSLGFDADARSRLSISYTSDDDSETSDNSTPTAPAGDFRDHFTDDA